MTWTTPARLSLPLAIVLAPALASAHVAMTDPAPRSGDNGLTTEPCGDVPAGTPTMFAAGETITVSWAVGQPHGGYLRIDFAEADDVFGGTVLATDIPDTEGNPTSHDVTLPDISCDACTLRVIQVNPNESNYVSCADVQLVGGGTSSGGSGGTGDSTGVATTDDTNGSTGGGNETSGGESTTTAGSATAGSATAGSATGSDESTGAGGSGSTGPLDDDDGDGGCSCNTDRSGGGALGLALLGLLALPRRRRARID